MQRTLSNDQLVESLRTILEDAESLLAPRATLPRRVKQFGRRFGAAREVAMERAREAADNTSAWVRANPWRTIGVVAVVGSLVGWMMGKRAVYRLIED